ncbi:MAG: ATPase, T2SS/T4P/T4SS family [Candidatus Peribacteraceae bacterium]|nr:ATPase, T2SS/T4P/T4SS family [Candidatus Peribacteraceae bacterium]
MQLNNQELGKILVAQSYLSEEELQDVLREAGERRVDIPSILFERRLLTSDLLENALCEYYKLPFYDVGGKPPSRDAVAALPEEFARTRSCIVVDYVPKQSITVATADPLQDGLEEAVRLNVGQPVMIRAPEKGAKAKKSFWAKTEHLPEPFAGSVTFCYAPKGSISNAFTLYHKPLATRFQAIIGEQKKVAPEILEEIFQDAMILKASDIHFEPQETDVIVRFRVDGVMHEAGRLPKQFYEGIVNRIKIEANLRIDEHYAAQDGAIRYKSKTGTMDVRVSIIPIVDGEKVVMRLLSEYVRNLTLADLGFSDHYRDILERAAHKPFGMIITTGPTGSGKSTTLYGLIKMRNRPDVNISTIEDPVEYKIPGINHIQVNVGTGLTFSKGLRSLVRQDPDIVLVGEIRDSETATIAVNAALTGHLLFSTLHANDSATAIPRLIEMGVEPFLLASTLEVIVAQRLARRICPNCRFSFTVTATEARSLFRGAEHYFTGDELVHLYRGKGCQACGNTGYRGRVGIYELLEVTKHIEELITQRKNSTAILMAAREDGMSFLFEDGLDKARAGLTTIEELMRIAAPPDEVFFKHATHANRTDSSTGA